MAAAEQMSSQRSSDSPASIAQRRAVIDRIAASASFSRSTRLRDFLLYVGGQSLKEGCPDIHEQEIGARVFDRPASYDRSQDNIVRVNATELRKRIDLYFATEGAHEPLILEIPRGGYKPVFHWRSPEIDKTVSPLPKAPPLSVPYATVNAAPSNFLPSRSVHLLWGALCAALAITVLLVLQQNWILHKAASPWNGKPALESFWTGFFQNSKPTDVVLPDDSVSVMQDVIRRPILLEDYLNRNYMLQIQASGLSADRKVDLDQLFGHNLITFGSVRAAQDVLAQIPATPTPHLTLSRYYTADALKQNNVVLIGGEKANPWVHLFDDRLNFITDYDYRNMHAFVGNLHPQPGEQARYEVSPYPNALLGYTVIAYLPNPCGAGKAIILAGTDSDATAASAEFLTSEERLESLRNLFHAQTLPYFELLLKSSRLSGTSFSSEIIAYRTYPGLR